jgi:hypothetical protein
MSDRTRCAIKDSLLYLYYGEAKMPQAVCIREHDFPGKSAYFRVDSGRPVQAGTDGCGKSPALILGILGAKAVRLRWVKWPYEHNRDAELSLDGLKTAHALVRHVLTHKKRLSFD